MADGESLLPPPRSPPPSRSLPSPPPEPPPSGDVQRPPNRLPSSVSPDGRHDDSSIPGLPPPLDRKTTDGRTRSHGHRTGQVRLSSSSDESRPSPASSSSSSWVSELDDATAHEPALRPPETKASPAAAPEKERAQSHQSADPAKVLKLSPTRLGELLVDTPTPSALQPSQGPVSPTRSRSTTNPTKAPPSVSRDVQAGRPSAQDRTLSTPPVMRRTRSSPRPLEINTKAPMPEMPPQPFRRGSRGAEMWGGAGVVSPQKPALQTPALKSSVSKYFGLDGGYDGASRPTPARSVSTFSSPDHIGGMPANAVRGPSTTHLLKTATSPAAHASSFPPLPIQSYLSLALSSPTSTSFPSHSYPTPQKPDPSQTQHQNGAVYGPPPHHPDSSSAIAMERIVNFLILPPKLESALIFGVLACLDSWLYMFTILPLRFLKALGVLAEFWWRCFKDFVTNNGGNKLQKARRGRDGKKVEERAKAAGTRPGRRKGKEKVSDLLPSHKADILRGMVVFTSCWFLMRFDASKMYHGIRAQSGIKLYVIYNMLEFGDRLGSAIGQDIFECLFSRETLERGADGRSKVLRPFGFFLLALLYNIAHSLALFYQVITLNVAVNSYSNALMTLLLSVQFVEIKSTVFKKFEKENLFQLTCADIVERFQLLLMLAIIAARNLVEVGVWSLAGAAPVSSGSALPKAFTVFPMLKWTGQVLGPFLMVLGSEMCVDWIKHAYITKFNNTRPIIYERFLDVQCRDYYSSAFTDQNLTKRLGLPVIPLACLFIRATIQTYHMFLATHIPLPPPSSTTSLTPSPGTSPEHTAALAQLDHMLRRALGRSSFGANTDPSSSVTDDCIAAVTMMLFLLCCFLVFLALKLVLGVVLLGFARSRYKGMKERERLSLHTGSRRVGGFGTVEVTEDVRKTVYEGDPEGERRMREIERRGREKDMSVDMISLEGVNRYDMVAKRIW